jgi:hypothetical protein
VCDSAAVLSRICPASFFFLLSRNNAGPMKLGIIGPVPLSGSPKFQI